MVTGGIYKENAFSVVFVAKGEDIHLACMFTN